MAETSLEQSYPISFAELIYTFSNTPTAGELCCSIENEHFESSSFLLPTEIIYCPKYLYKKESVCNGESIILQDFPELYFSAPAKSPTIAPDSMQQNSSPSFATENPDIPKSFSENINWVMSYIKTVANSEALPISVAVGSIGLALYYTSTGLPYLLSGTGVGAIALVAGLYLDSTFINNSGIEVIKYSAMKFFAHSIEDRLIPNGRFMVAPLAAIAASSITTAWIILANKITAIPFALQELEVSTSEIGTSSCTNGYAPNPHSLSHTQFLNCFGYIWESDSSLDRIPYTELLPAVVIKRIIQDTITTQLPNIIELIPYVPKNPEVIKIISDSCGLFTAGVVKDTIYAYREVKNYTQAEIFGRQFFSTSFKMLPGWIYFDDLKDKTLSTFTFEWTIKAISRNLGKISFESISEYFNPKQPTSTITFPSTANPKSVPPSKHPVYSDYQLAASRDDNDSLANK